MAKVIDPLILLTQTAFLKGRQLVEEVVVVNEVIDYAKKTGKECFILKVDFEKAYDSVDWGFLDYMLQRFGFSQKWRAWMRACVCTGNMSVLVNGSPTGEISIKRDLKQGDPLIQLLFLLVAEGLGSLMRKVVEQNRFKPFWVGGEEVPISILQYADDTLCISEATVDNLWALKTILRGFEMASGLKVNFWKSCLVGVNVPEEFLYIATGLLNCRRGHMPIKYLGLPVGANPRKMSTWEPMLAAIRGRLGAWGNKYVCLGGRIMLINAVLSALPILYLSFMKIPVQVWKEVVKIQRSFLWGGLSKKSRNCWVKWDDICKPKKEAGLGIRDLRRVNLSLLAKWRWKLRFNDSELWKDVIKYKYGRGCTGSGNLVDFEAPRLGSTWWKDICRLDKESLWFLEAIEKNVGDGTTTRFWTDIWVGNQSLQNRFPRLYSIFSQKENTIRNMGRWEGQDWRWEMVWLRSYFGWEENINLEFLNLIQHFVPTTQVDTWLWRSNRDARFSVNDCYVMLHNKFSVHRVMEPLKLFAFSKI
jgi:hypothetical protein